MSKTKRNTKYYAVKYVTRKYKGVIFEDYSSVRCQKFLKGKELGYKVFTSSEEAVAYLGCKITKVHFIKREEQKSRNCLLCEKPFIGKTKLCPSCNKKRKIYSLSAGSIVTLKMFHQDQDIFALLEKYPNIRNEIQSTTKKMRAEIRKSRSTELKSINYQNHYFLKDEKDIPPYIINFMQKQPDKKLQGIEGLPTSLKVYYICSRCQKEQCQDIKSLMSGHGHDCESLLSSGEAIVQAYLDSIGIEYKTQYETLRCINPITKRIMPYDIQLENYQIIIEVQGNQHYEYIPYFHGTLDNYEYQQQKDKFKKEFAENAGFLVCYINYKQIISGEFKDLIMKSIQKFKKTEIFT